MDLPEPTRQVTVSSDGGTKVVARFPRPIAAEEAWGIRSSVGLEEARADKPVADAICAVLAAFASMEPTVDVDHQQVTFNLYTDVDPDDVAHVARLLDQHLPHFAVVLG